MLSRAALQLRHPLSHLQGVSDKVVGEGTHLMIPFFQASRGRD